MVSIKDIARAAKVSHATVSRALRHSRLVNAKTGALIRKIAAEQGYTASAVARSLVTRRTSTIGIVVTSVADPFVGEIVSGIEDTALARGYSVLLVNCHADPARELRAVQSLQERRVDGVLVNASRVGALYLPMLAGLQVPIVLINNQHPGDFVYSVSIDNTGAGLAATRHLTELGHKRIAYIGDRFGSQSDTERLAGYRRALEQAGLKLNPDLVVHGDGRPGGGCEAMARLLALPRPPTAVFCYNDLTAVGAMRAARESGVEIPERLSIVGMDDLFLAAYTDPPLTTVHQPKHEMGSLATEILMDLLNGAKPESHRVISGRLIERQSTAGPQPLTTTPRRAA